MPSRSLEHYPTDIVDHVIERYAADAIPLVHGLLEELDSDRLSRCALFVADGSIQELREAVKLGKLDYRDLIVNAEYDRSMNQLRDFNQPFDPKK